MGRGTSGPSTGVKPQIPVRKWWQYLPVFKQRYQDQLSQYSQDYNYWMWNQENQYNTPKSQMGRYREAGLNPNLIYGNPEPGNASPGKPSVDPQKQEPQLLEKLAATQSLKMQNVQMDKIRADTEYTKSKTKTEGYRFDIAHIQKLMTASQFTDLTRDLEAKDMTIGQLTESLKDGTLTQRQGIKLAQYGKEMSTSDIQASEAVMRAQMVEWLTANNLAKWIPILGPILGLIK